MTLAELFIFLVAAAAIYFLLRPLQRRLESFLRKFLKARPREPGDVIDITDHSKKDKNS